MEPSFTIKATAQMTSLNAHSIRAWERRYSALTPSRHENGRRLYSQEDVSRLKLLAGLVSRGHSISSIAALSSEILSTMTEEKTSGRISPDSAGPWPHEFGLDKMSPSQSAQDIKDSQYHRTPILNHSYQTRTDKRPPADSVSQLVLDHCLRALHSYDLVMINSELEAAKLLFSAKDFVTLLAVPLIIRVGELVISERLSIAQEHALSAVLRSQMMQILFNARNSLAVRSFTRKDLPQGKVFAVATQEGDLHEFGALAASIIIAVNGHVPHYFGANMPVKALADAANAIGSQVVVVGVTYIPPERRILTDQEYGVELERDLRPSTAIWWGGRTDFDEDFLVNHPRHRALSSLEELDLLLRDTPKN